MTQTRRIYVRSAPARVLSKRHSTRPMEIVAAWWKTGGETHGRSPPTRNERCCLPIAWLVSRSVHEITRQTSKPLPSPEAGISCHLLLIQPPTDGRQVQLA